jgi:hypothetical protein
MFTVRITDSVVTQITDNNNNNNYYYDYNELKLVYLLFDEAVS